MCSSTSGILQFVSSISQQELWAARDSAFPSPTHTILLGGIRLRQLRVQGENCTRISRKLVFQGLLSAFECYPAWEDGVEETTYAKEDNSLPSDIGGSQLYEYLSATDTQESPVQGNYGTYPGSGFVVQLSSNSSESISTIGILTQQQWLDWKTRALFVNFVTYNPDLDLFVISRILFEFLPSGVISMSSYVHAFNLDDFRTDGGTNYVRIAMTCLIYLIVAMKLAALVDDCRKNGLNKFGSVGWHYVQAANILLFVLSGFVRIANDIINLIAFPDNNYNTDSVTSHILRSLNDLSTSMDLLAKIDGLNALLLWIEIGRFLEQFTRRLTRCSETISKSTADILTFAFLFSILAFAFAVLGFLFHGNEVEDFATISNCADTILRAMYGDVDFSEILWYSGPSGAVFLFVWLLVSNTVLLNMTVGIIIDTFHRVVREEDEFKQGQSIMSTVVSDLRDYFHTPNSEKEDEMLPQEQDNVAGSMQTNGWNLSGSEDGEAIHESSIGPAVQGTVSSVARWRPWQDKIFPEPNPEPEPPPSPRRGDADGTGDGEGREEQESRKPGGGDDGDTGRAARSGGGELMVKDMDDDGDEESSRVS